VTGSPLTTFHRDLIVTLAARQRLPAVYPYRFFVTGGGLISYGPDLADQYRRAASYVDRGRRAEDGAENGAALCSGRLPLLGLGTSAPI
jgi:putative tryptophan/tyrosine transport system substrate-binding protein